MTIIKHRDIRGLVGTLCGACIVTLVALGFGAAPARAQTNFNPLPPQVRFISHGLYTGTLQIQGLTVPITGTLVYLTGVINYLHNSVDTEPGRPITSDTWVKTLFTIPTVVNEWEIVSTDPTTCRKEVLSGASFPQCTAWTRNFQGAWLQECTVTAQGNKTTLDSSVTLDNTNQLVALQENATIKGENNNSQANESDITNSITITMTSQGNTAPVPSDFNLPSICNAPNGNNQSEKVCTGTIPNICF